MLHRFHAERDTNISYKTIQLLPMTHRMLSRQTPHQLVRNNFEDRKLCHSFTRGGAPRKCDEYQRKFRSYKKSPGPIRPWQFVPKNSSLTLFQLEMNLVDLPFLLPYFLAPYLFHSHVTSVNFHVSLFQCIIFTVKRKPTSQLFRLQPKLKKKQKSSMTTF